MKSHLRKRCVLFAVVPLLLCSGALRSSADNTVIITGGTVWSSNKKGTRNPPCIGGPVAAYRNKNVKSSESELAAYKTDNQGRFTLEADGIGTTVPDLWVMMDRRQNDYYVDPVEVNLGAPDNRTNPLIIQIAPDLLVKSAKDARSANNLSQAASFSAAVIETHGVFMYLLVESEGAAKETAQGLVSSVMEAQGPDNSKKFADEVLFRLNAFVDTYPFVIEQINSIGSKLGIKLADNVHRHTTVMGVGHKPALFRIYEDGAKFVTCTSRRSVHSTSYSGD